MRFLYFPGCKIPYYLPSYDKSTRDVLAALDQELVDVELNCCGYPVRHKNFKAFILLAARNFALAEAEGLDILTPCKCCYGSLKHAEYWLRRTPSLVNDINSHLAPEGLAWHGKSRILHLLSVLSDEIGIDSIKRLISSPLEGLMVAAHYGCHALRPSDVVQMDNPLAPTIFERLIAVTGATAVNWPMRLECCGHPLSEKNDSLSLALMEKKCRDAADAGAHVLTTACTYCQLQFDRASEKSPKACCENMPQAVLFTQLLGTAMGLNNYTFELKDCRQLADDIRNIQSDQLSQT